MYYIRNRCYISMAKMLPLPTSVAGRSNHHAHPRSAKFSVRRLEFDPSWPVIRVLAAMCLVVVVGPPVAWAGASAGRGAPLGPGPTRIDD